MNRYSFRIVIAQPLRLALTICGVALCIMLMLFLLSVYQGVAVGSMEYIRHNEADLWILQHNSWNILRGTSLLSTGHGTLLRQLPYVESASPVLLLLPGVTSNGRTATTFLAGYDPDSPLGGPPRITDGRQIESDDEIVIDEAFAARMGVRVGSSVEMNGEPLQVVGISSGTNAFVIQYSFTSLRRAQFIIGHSAIVSCYLVKLKPGHSVAETIEALRDDLPGVEVFDHPTFVANNRREMESGLLPLLSSIAAIGAIVLTVILSLLLSISILERKKDFAVMKTLGAPKSFLPRLVTEQALIISAAGSVVAVILFFPMCQIISAISPEMNPVTTLEQVIAVLAAAGFISLASSLISIRRLRRIYALEAFA